MANRMPDSNLEQAPEPPRPPITYLALRVVNIAIRPLTLVVFALNFGDFNSSIIALSYTFGAWLMVPMSLGSYRWVLPIERRFERGSRFSELALVAYTPIVLISILIFVPVSFVVSALLMDSLAVGAVVAQIVVYDFLIHEQSRRKLYSGNLTGWAWYLVQKNALIPFVWTLALAAAYVLGPNLIADRFSEILALGTLPLTLATMATFFSQYGRFRQRPHSAIQPSLLAGRLITYWQYAATGILTKFHVHVDRLLAGVLLPEFIWIVSLVNYMAMIPVTLFEMVNLATLKSRILGLDRDQVNSLKYVSGRDVQMLGLGTVPAFIAMTIFLLYRESFEAALWLACLYALFASIFAISLKHSEMLFWMAKDRWAPFNVDLRAAVVTAVGAIGVVALGSASLLFLKLPALLGACAKYAFARRALEEALTSDSIR